MTMLYGSMELKQVNINSTQKFKFKPKAAIQYLSKCNTCEKVFKNSEFQWHCEEYTIILT